MKNALRQLGLWVAGLAFLHSARAEDLNVSLLALQPSVTAETGIMVDGGLLLPHLGATAGLAVGYANAPLVLRQKEDGGVDKAALKHQVMLHLFGAVGLFNYGEIGIDVPMTVFQGGAGLDWSPGSSDLKAFPSGNPLGNVRLILKGGYPVHRLFRLSGLVEQSFPTGKESEGAMAGLATAIRVAGSVVLQQIAFLNIHVNLGVRVRWQKDQLTFTDENSNTTKILDIGHQLTWGLGLEFPLLRGVVAPIAEIYGFSSLTEPFQKRNETSLEWQVGVRGRPIGPLALQVSAGTGILSGFGSPQYRVLFSAAWTPGRRDADSDGVPDDMDRCPGEPEDLDGYNDEDGCIDPDNDGDMVPDDADRCPNVAEDRDGFEDDDGCADPDNDKDGIPDADDKCPSVAEDRDGFKDEDGCPDPDNDNDGIPDAFDKCPNEPESPNGVDDQDGCPDKEGNIRVRGNVIVFVRPLPIDERDPALLAATAKPMLSELSALLKASPQYKKIRIEAHMDNTGGSKKAMERSESLANAVLDYLMGEGVDLNRLEPKGYGAERPLAPNSTPEGRAKNRRIEIRIIE